jgi:hypothetical protein
MSGYVYTLTATSVPTCSVLISENYSAVLPPNIDSETFVRIYSYNFSNNSKTLLYDSFTIGLPLIVSDIAHTDTKLWLSEGFGEIREYNITLSPWSMVQYRIITLPTNVRTLGMGVINNTTLLASTQTSPVRIVSLDITTTTALVTNIANLPSTLSIPYDILYTTNNKIIATTRTTSLSSSLRWVLQFDYLTGVNEVVIPLPSGTSPNGLAIENNNLYTLMLDGKVYLIDKTPPYNKTLVQTISGVASIAGASSLPSCSTTSIDSDYFMYCLDPCVPQVSCGYCENFCPGNDIEPCLDPVYSVTMPMPSVDFLDDFGTMTTCNDIAVYDCNSNEDTSIDFRVNRDLLFKNYNENLEYIYSGGSQNNVPNNLTSLYNFFGGFNTMFYKGKLRNVNYKWYRPLSFYPEYNYTTSCSGSPKLSTIFGGTLTGFTYLSPVNNISLAPTPSVAGKLIRTTGSTQTTYFWNPITLSWVNIYSVADCVAPTLLNLLNAMTTYKNSTINEKTDVMFGLSSFIFAGFSVIAFQFQKFKGYSFPSSLCSNYEISNPNNTPATIDEPLEFDLCPRGGDSRNIFLPKSYTTFTGILKGDDGFCYGIGDYTTPIYAGYPMITLNSTYANCTDCVSDMAYISISTTSDCNGNVVYNNYSTTSMVYRVNGGSWITVNNANTTSMSGYYQVPINQLVTIGTVIELYFPGISWGIGYLSGDFTSRCDNQPYTITITNIPYDTSYYFNLKSKVTTGPSPTFATTCGYQACPGYLTPRPWRWNLYDWDLATPYYMYSDSQGVYNSKDYYPITNSTYTSTISYVWYEPTQTTWYNTPVLGNTNTIYSSLISADSLYPVSGPSNNWVSSTESYPSILSSEPQGNITTIGLIVWLDAGSDLSWPGSGTQWNDITDNNNDSTFYQLLSAATPNYLPAVGGSFSFNGTNQKFTIPNSITLSGITNTVSVEVWLKPTLFDNRDIFSKNSNQGFRMRLDTTGHLWMLGANSSSIDTYTSNDTATLNQWNQVVAVWTPSGFYTYINGVDSGSDLSKSLLVQQYYLGLDIGCFTGNDNHYQGDMAIFRIYNRVLTSDEVLSNYLAQQNRFGIMNY